jgi:hypothetical protein
MLKKFLAALSAIALGLGMVAVTAGPASAHHSTITAATVQCTSPTTATITWSVQNWNGGKAGKVDSSTAGIVPVGTQFSSNETKTFTQNITAAGTYALSVTMSWKDGSAWKNQTTNSGSVTVGASVFTACQPDDTSKKVVICHATASNSNPYTSNNVSVASIINLDPNGHGAHQSDIIPPFDYVKQGVAGSYPGKNWTSYGQWIWNNGCSNDVTPAAPSFADAVCTGPGQFGDGSYTIPAATGVKYLVRINGGSWAEKAAGTYAVAKGTKVELKAEALSGYDLAGTTSWSRTIGGPANCDTSVTPTAATFSAAVCAAAGQYGPGGYTIPATTGVKYLVSVGNGAWVEKAAGTYSVAKGTKVQVQAQALAGYALSGTTTWTTTITGPASCDVTVTATRPTSVDGVCVAEGQVGQGAVTVPAITGVSYQYWDGNSWESLAAGTHQVDAGTVVWVRAVAQAGYKLQGDDDWLVTVGGPNAGKCVVVASPSFADVECTAPGKASTATYTIPADAGVKYQVRTASGWTNIAAGTYDVAGLPATVEIQAVKTGSNIIVPGSTTSWSHDFAAPGDCLVDATPADVTFTQPVCVGLGESAEGGYEILAIPTGVVYSVTVNGVESVGTAGFHALEAGDTVTVTAAAAPGYVLTAGDWTWSTTVESPGDCLTPARVAYPPQFVDAVCDVENPGEPTTASYEIFATKGVTYEVSTDGVTYTATGAEPGVHEATPGSEIWIRAVAQPGYVLVGGGVWHHEYTDPGDCLVEVPVTAPTVEAQTCTVDEQGAGTLVAGFITIPDTEHVSYLIAPEQTPATAGEHQLPPGTYTVSAVADPGYELVGYDGPWELTITAAELCGDLVTKPLVTPVAIFTPATCDADAYYILANQEGEPGSVVWTVNGQPAIEGTHVVATTGTVTVVATPAEGYGFAGESPTLEWTFEFTAPADCARGGLPTLALTGGTAVGALGLAAALLAAGGILLAVRRRESATR